MELQRHFKETRGTLIPAINFDINLWLGDVAAMGKHAQRCFREQPPAENATPDVPDLVFT